MSIMQDLRTLIDELRASMADGLGRFKAPAGYFTHTSNEEFDEAVSSYTEEEDGEDDSQNEDLAPTVLGDQAFHLGTTVMRWRFNDLASQMLGNVRVVPTRRLLDILRENHESGRELIQTVKDEKITTHPITVKEFAEMVALKIVLGIEHEVPGGIMIEVIGGRRTAPCDVGETWHHEINKHHGYERSIEGGYPGPVELHLDDVAINNRPQNEVKVKAARQVVMARGETLFEEAGTRIVDLSPVCQEIGSLIPYLGKRSGFVFSNVVLDLDKDTYTGPHLVEVVVGEDGCSKVPNKFRLFKKHIWGLEKVRRCARCKRTFTGCKCGDKLPRKVVEITSLMSGPFLDFMGDRVQRRDFVFPPIIRVRRRRSKGDYNGKKLFFTATVFLPIPRGVLTKLADPTFKPNALAVRVEPVWNDDLIWDYCWENTQHWYRMVGDSLVKFHKV